MSEIILAMPTYSRPDLAVRCIDSALRGTLIPRVVYVIDNLGKFAHADARIRVVSPAGNRGVAGSLNLIHQLTRPHDTIICNDDVEFGPRDIERMVACPAPFVAGLSWGAFLQREEVWEKVGDYDVAFYPIYFEDNDYCYRMKLAGIDYTVPDGMEIGHVGSATLHSLADDERRAFDRRFMDNKAYYVRKWGGLPGAEKYKTPFGA